MNDDNGKFIGDRVTTFPDPMTEEGYHFPSHKMGARMFMDVRMPVEMTKADKGRMQDLARYNMIASANMLGYRQGRHIEAYTAKEIGNLAELSKGGGKRFVAKMLRLRIMQKVKVNTGVQFYVNPAYYMANGHRLSLNLFLLFKEELMPILPDWAADEFLSMAQCKDWRGGLSQLTNEGDYAGLK